MLLVDERCLQPNLVGADRIVPVASVAASAACFTRSAFPDEAILVLGRCCTTSLPWTLEEGRRGSQAILDTAG
jgi:hypothetical protein